MESKHSCFHSTTIYRDQEDFTRLRLLQPLKVSIGRGSKCSEYQNTRRQTELCEVTHIIAHRNHFHSCKLIADKSKEIKGPRLFRQCSRLSQYENELAKATGRERRSLSFLEHRRLKIDRLPLVKTILE